MPYGGAKVYFDGSHYIAIPPTTRIPKKRYVKLEERVEVKEESKDSKI